MIASPELLDILFLNNPEPMWIIDTETLKFLAVNEAAINCYGYSREEFLSMTIIDIRPEQEKIRLKSIMGLDYTDSSLLGVWYHLKKNNEVIKTASVTVQQFNFNGRNAIAEYIKDITKESLNNKIMDYSPDLICTSDSDKILLTINKASKNILGYEPEELIGRKLNDFIHPDDTLKTNKASANIKDGQVTNNFENRYIHKNGSIVYIMWSAYWSEQEKTTFAIGRDITLYKQKEEKIKFQSNLLDKSKDSIMVYDLDWNISFWNKSSEKLFGWKSEEVLGKNAKLLYKNSDDIVESYNSLIKNGEYSKEIIKLTSENKEILVESHKTLVYDDNNTPECIFVINTDITEKKAIETQFLRSQRLESLGTLASGIAHDLNNALTPILMAVELLKNKLTDERSERILKNVHSSALHAAEMVKQVLTFAKGAEGNNETLDIKLILNEIEKIIVDTFPKNIDIQFDIKDDVWNLKADSTQIHQVIMNLCVNSKDALIQGGTIRVKSENIVIDEHYAKMHQEFKTGLYVLIEVSDSGTGIPKEIINKVFDPFFTTKPVGHGTGLGLSTSLSIIKSHKGFINIYSEPGNGTKIKIYIPALITPEFKQFKEKQKEILKGNNELILVIDDEKSILNITEETLKSFGYRVLTAGDGTEGITLYLKNSEEIKAVITDMVMPYMDGLATIRALLRINPKLKIIAASGLEANGKIAEALELGISDFIVKPFTTERLLKAIKNIMLRLSE